MEPNHARRLTALNKVGQNSERVAIVVSSNAGARGGLNFQSATQGLRISFMDLIYGYALARSRAEGKEDHAYPKKPKADKSPLTLHF